MEIIQAFQPGSQGLAWHGCWVKATTGALRPFLLEVRLGKPELLWTEAFLTGIANAMIKCDKKDSPRTLSSTIFEKVCATSKQLKTDGHLMWSCVKFSAQPPIILVPNKALPGLRICGCRWHTSQHNKEETGVWTKSFSKKTRRDQLHHHHCDKERHQQPLVSQFPLYYTGEKHMNV